jgi:secreted trypsin-like serine protease
VKSLALCALVIGVLLSAAGGARGAAPAARPSASAGGERGDIVGGYPAQPGTFRMLAYVEINLPVGQSEVCSGTVVAANVVLTAGHCAENAATGTPHPTSEIEVVTGTANLAHPAGAQVSAVSQVMINPGYDPSTRSGDAALLVLATPTTAPPVSIASDADDLTAYAPGVFGLLAGWGTAEGAVLPSRLQWGGTVVQSPAYCGVAAQTLGLTFDQGAQLCVLDAPTDADSPCEGDSGGPLLVQTDQGLQETALISTVQSACDSTQPGFLTATAPLAGWISNVVAAASDPAPSPPVALASLTPTPGAYYGTTNQGYRIFFRVSTTDALSGVKLAFQLKCPDHAPLAYHYTPVSATTPVWPLSAGTGGASIRRAFIDSSGERYRLSGTFSAAGIATGTLSSVWPDSGYGACRTGTVTWHAILSS